MKRNAYRKDTLRSIGKGWKRFFSILLITALGVGMFGGIYAACQDIYHAADRFFDNQQLFDIRVLSTLGLTEEDVEALQYTAGVSAVEGSYNETVYIDVNDVQKKADVAVLSQKGLNTPYLLAGALPRHSGEIAVTQKYLRASGKSVGNTLTIVEDENNDEADQGEKNSETSPGTVAKTSETALAKDDGGDDGPDTDVNWDTEVKVEKSEKPNFLQSTFTITGVVIDPMNVSNTEGNAAFRFTSTADYNFFVTSADVRTDIYTSVYLTLRDVSGLSCFSDAYDEAVRGTADAIEAQTMQHREQARYDAVAAEARGKIADAETVMREKFAEAEQKFANAWADVAKARQDILDGEAELTDKERDARQKIADARVELEKNKQKLRDAEVKLAEGEEELSAGAKELFEGIQQLADQRQLAEANFTEAESHLSQAQVALDASLSQLTPQVKQLKELFGDAWPAAEWDALVEASAANAQEQLAANPTGTLDAAAVAVATAAEQGNLAAAIAETGNATLMGTTPNCVQAALSLGVLNGSQQALDSQKDAFAAQKSSALAQMAKAEVMLDKGREELGEGAKKIRASKRKIADGWAKITEGEDTINEEEEKANLEIADAWQELADGKLELTDGEAKLEKNEAKYRSKKAEAEQKVADAYSELDNLDMPQWYVQNRTALDSFSGMNNELASIEALSRIFPVIFLIVAILTSLTTMTRMVEEERGLIGTYRALGYSDWAISRKYVTYASLASVLGGAVGNVLSFIVLPRYLLKILQVLYTVPNYTLEYDALYGIGGAALFIAAIVGATMLVCHSELRQMPAALLRPKAPRIGSHVLLERIPLIWNHLRFLNKVTARNLFRYKKRLIMTVVGIMGCTTLLLVGYAIRDTVNGLMIRQYGEIFRFDLMLVADAGDRDEFYGLLDREDGVGDYIPMQIDTIKVINEQGDSEQMRLMVVPNGISLEGYINTPNREGASVRLDNAGILLTRNAAMMLALEPGNTIYLQNLKLDQHKVVVSDIAENYLGNSVYITEDLYHTMFGDFAANGALVHLKDTVPDQEAYAHGFLDYEYVRSSVSRVGMEQSFADNFALVNAVILLLIVLAAGLAFVVLFTLSNINISERERELATIKVLGFFDFEVHAYVNKETLILTVLGVLAGLPAGYAVSHLIVSTLRISSVNFAFTIKPVSYLISGAITFGFALAVSLMTNRTLDRINMVEALKSME